MGRELCPSTIFSVEPAQKEFSKILTISEHEKGGIICPHCKSKDIGRRWAAFYAVTSKKS
jgi:hypothetical protein